MSFRITNNSGAHIPLDGLNLGPYRSLIVKSIPRSLQSVAKFVTVEPISAPQVAPVKVAPMTKTEQSVSVISPDKPSRISSKKGSGDEPLKEND